MINLLPPKQKKEVEKEIIFRKILAIFSFHFLCVLLLLFFFGYLSGFLSGKAKQAQADLALQQERLAQAKMDDYRSETAKLNNYLANLDIFWKRRIAANVVFKDVFPLLSDSFSFSGIGFRLTSKTLKASPTASSSVAFFAETNFDGVALSREALYELKKALESQKKFSDVYFAPSSWSKPKNSPFSFKLNFSLGI